MTPHPTLRRLLTDYRDSYARAVLVLALNVPIAALLLLRDVGDVEHTGLTVAYLAFVALGYYALISLIAITLVSPLALVARRLALLASGLILTLLVYYLALDGFIFNIFKFHLDAFWLAHIVTDYDTMGVPLSALLAAILLLVAAGAMEYGLFVLARRIRRTRGLTPGFVAAVLVSFCLGQAIYMVAYERDYSRITILTPRLPLYYPLTWHQQATRYGGLLSWAMGPGQSPGSQGPRGFQYPLRPLSCPAATDKAPPNIVILFVESWRYDAMNAAVSPNIDSLASRSSTFLRHFSSGNSTPAGLFGLFFGVHPTYWPAVVAQNAAIHNPVLIDLLTSRGYALGIYSEHFERHKIAETMFRGIAVHDTFAGATPNERDADMNRQLEAFITDAARRHRPFLAFEFFKSTHYSYYYPPANARFQPSQKLNVGLAGGRKLIALYLNDYRNSVNYVDELVGHVVHRLETLGLMDNTIIVVTGDHGEEFNDDGAGYWGHASNFTAFQTRVPMVMYVPGKPRRRVTAVTSHVDIPVTLIQEICGGAQDVREYANGLNLFKPLPNERPVVVSSYVNHAFILGDDVYAVFPVYVQRYKLDDIRAQAGPPRSDLMRVAMEEVTRFSGGGSGLAKAREPRRPPAAPLAHAAARSGR